MLRQALGLGIALIGCLALGSGAAAIADGPPTEAVAKDPGLFGTVDQRTRELPATHWALTLDFPVDLAERMLWDAAYLVTQPARWEAPDWERFGLFAASTGGAFGADRTIDIESRRRHPRSASERSTEDGIEELGSVGGVAAVVGGSALFGLFTGNEQARQVSVDSGEALILSTLFTAGLKEVVGRSRPREGEGPFQFHPFSGNASFPSGHATSAFTMAAVLGEHFDNSPWVAIPAYALAAGVGLARMRANAHFASDVVVGAAIGVATGREIVALERGRLEREQGSGGSVRVSVAPAVGPTFSGLEMTVRF